ncbi:MAG: glycosyltransferase [Elainellaceae cyanobacterium]
MKKTSVIVLVKNRKRHLRNLLRGIHRLNASAVETVIVHMNEAAQPPPDFFTGKYTTAEVWNSTAQLPLAEARNQGAKTARGDRLIFLDVDCIPAKNALTDYSRAFDVAPDAIAMGAVYYLSTQLPESWDESDLVIQGRPHPVRTYPETGMLQPTEDYHLFWSLNFGLRKSVWDEISGFDERFQGYGAEDTDFSFSAKERGVCLAWLGGGTVFHQYPDQYSPPLQHFKDIVRNAEVFYHKRHWWPMENWLQQFAAAGYIEWSSAASTIGILLEPTDDAIAAAHRA